VLSPPIERKENIGVSMHQYNNNNNDNDKCGYVLTARVQRHERFNCFQTCVVVFCLVFSFGEATIWFSTVTAAM